MMSFWPPADRTIDAGGKYVLPGLIDVHTHWGAGGSFGQSCMTETKAAALGGVTTVGMFGMFPDTPQRDLEGATRCLALGVDVL